MWDFYVKTKNRTARSETFSFFPFADESSTTAQAHRHLLMIIRIESKISQRRFYRSPNFARRSTHLILQPYHYSDDRTIGTCGQVLTLAIIVQRQAIASRSVCFASCVILYSYPCPSGSVINYWFFCSWGILVIGLQSPFKWTTNESLIAIRICLVQ